MKKIPMLDLRGEYLYMKSEIDKAITTCFEHQRWILGPEVKALEAEIQKYLGAKHCIGVGSGTDALVISMRALSLKSGNREYFEKSDLVITSPFTFTATGDAILRAGATPLFVDIDPETYNVTPSKIEACIKKYGKKIVGIVPVHLYGLACDMDGIMELAGKHGLFVVEDVAQAFGGEWKGKRLGTIGSLGAFSFFPSKNLGSFGDGGMIATNDDGLADFSRMLLKHGGKDKYNVDHVGYNSRLDTMQAAVLLAKFKFIDELGEKRRQVARKYTEGLQGQAKIKLPVSATHDFSSKRHVFHQYTVRVSGGKRDQLQALLKEREIDTMIYYPISLHKMSLFKDRSESFEPLLESERASSEVISLPTEPLQSDEDTLRVIEAVRAF